MLKHLIVSIISLLVFASTAFGADRSEFDLIGYSSDGRYFAFEEYGIQDGSGFAFSTVFVIDLTTDTWVADSPFRERADTEDKSIFEMRSAALGAATAVLNEFQITKPARIIALNGDGEPESDELSLDFGVPGYTEPGAIWGEYELSFDIFKAPSSEDCMGYFGDMPMGFRLHLNVDDTSTTLHEDTKIPKSRGCPVTYRASAVVLPFGATDLSAGVALISVWAHGFEGLDRRYIAVPLSNGE